MEPITGVIQNYAWGSTDAIAGLRGIAPTGEPQAELWFGAHDRASSTLVDLAPVTLADRIAADPAHELGDVAVERFGARLPYLLKILAAAEPLSIQVHPSIEQARSGYEREERAGVDRSAPGRSFPDDNHKPELIVALSEFEALVGFRPAAESASFLQSLGRHELAPLVDRLDADDLAGALRWILDPPSGVDMGSTVEAVVAACGGRDAFDAELLVRLDRFHRRDPGVLVGILLNHVVLEPGQGLFLDSGIVHAYVGGLGIEVMANSDNVLRGGLTVKPVDVDNLLMVARTEPSSVDLIRPRGSATTYVVPAPEFVLLVLREPDRYRHIPAGPEIVLSLCDGTRIESAGDAARELGATDAVWTPNGSGIQEITSPGLVAVVGVGALHSAVG